MLGSEKHSECVLLDRAGLKDLVQHLLHISMAERVLVGIAGVGGSGKSTLAQMLCDCDEAFEPDAVRVVPMDGFHYTNDQLDEMGMRNRKGAPETFDVHRFKALLRVIGEGEAVDFPVYDRNVHEPVMTGLAEHQIQSSTHVVLVEGNYLLLNEGDWCEMGSLLSECWWLDTPGEQVRTWLIQRHERGGRLPDDARAHYERVDYANAVRVLANRRRPDMVLRWPV
jgi:pantothenate kinase